MTPRETIAFAILQTLSGHAGGMNWYPLVRYLEGRIPPSPSVFEVIQGLIDEGALHDSDATSSAKIAITAQGRLVLGRLAERK